MTSDLFDTIERIRNGEDHWLRGDEHEDNLSWLLDWGWATGTRSLNAFEGVRLLPPGEQWYEKNWMVVWAFRQQSPTAQLFCIYWLEPVAPYRLPYQPREQMETVLNSDREVRRLFKRIWWKQTARWYRKWDLPSLPWLGRLRITDEFPAQERCVGLRLEWSPASPKTLYKWVMGIIGQIILLLASGKWLPL